MKLILKFLSVVAAASTATSSMGQYMTPVDSIAAIVEAEPLPVVMFTPKIDRMITFKWRNSKSLEFLYEYELRLAGLRFKPTSNTISNGVYCYDITVTDTKTGVCKTLKGIPNNAMVRSYLFSPDNTKLLFTNKTDYSTDLWLADLDRGTAKKLASDVNDIFPGVPVDWSGDGESVFYLRAANKTSQPLRIISPLSPLVRESGESEGYSDFQDLLHNTDDEDRFDFYAETEIIKLDLKTSKSQVIGSKGVITSFSVSPDGEYVLATYLQKPYSYNVPYTQFANTIKVIGGGTEEVIVENPLYEHAYSKVNSGARNINWCAQKPHTLLWATALDKGNIKTPSPYHDQITLYTIGSKKTDIIRLRNRLAGIYALNDTSIIIAETNSVSKYTDFLRVSTETGNADTFLICNEKTSPHRILQAPNRYGRKAALLYQNRYIYCTSEEYTKNGVQPTLVRLDLQTKKCRTIWKSKPPRYSRCEAFCPSSGVIAVKSESSEEYPNYYTEYLNGGAKPKKISDFESPYKTARIQSQLIKYTRSDGVQLSGTLYLPHSYHGNGTLPAIVWAYPKEYSSSSSASQISTSAFKFAAAGNSSTPIWLAAAGYAVLDASFPVVGKDGAEPNDDFINQIILDAEAAVNALVTRKIAQRDNIAVGGHSYGAFLTVNLLAHTNLFAAGIARSGCYNRTNTPLGFQNERRTLWQARDIYLKMSPIMYADSIKAPLLLIHGADDNNPSTPAVQSEKLYAAVMHCNGTAKLVILPNELHNYTASESILHAAWETQTWLERYLKKN